MDPSRFTSKKTGELVKITSPVIDVAFVPDPLPPRWNFPSTLWPALSDAKRLLGELDGIGRTLLNPDLLLTPLERREALTSSSLEGTHATPEQVLLFELQDDHEDRSDQAAPWREIANYRTALRQGQAYLVDNPPSLFLVRHLHEWLMSGVRGKDRSPGRFRTTQVFIGSDRRFIPPPPELLTDCLLFFEKAIRSVSSEFDPLVHCYLAHYQIEAIHPFGDGNGRVGRLLLSLMIARACSLTKPWLYLSPFFERHRSEYIDCLFDVSAKGAWTPWVRFCITGTIEQARDAITRCDLLIALRERMHRQTASGSGRLHNIVEDLFSTPLLTVPRLVQRLGVTYPTARSDIERLVELRILRRLGKRTHPMVFYAPEIFRIVFGELKDESRS